MSRHSKRKVSGVLVSTIANLSCPEVHEAVAVDDLVGEPGGPLRGAHLRSENVATHGQVIKSGTDGTTLFLDNS
jgi:hypothetical protein